jgi:alpha-beta hydrolase superfamily lysophospholipase
VLAIDFAKFAEIVRSAHPAETPTFIVCHSVGTLVVTLALKIIPDVRAAVFSGCALVSGPAASSLFGVKMLYPISQLSAAVTMSRAMASIDPRGPAAPIFDVELTSDVEELARIRDDPRIYHGSIMNRTAYQVAPSLTSSRRSPAACAPTSSYSHDIMASLPCPE